MFASVQEALEELKAGRFIVLVDDEDRENEGDLVCAAQLATPDMINFMIRQAAGKLCLALTAAIKYPDSWRACTWWRCCLRRCST